MAAKIKKGEGKRGRRRVKGKRTQKAEMCARCVRLKENTVGRLHGAKVGRTLIIVRAKSLFKAVDKAG